MPLLLKRENLYFSGMSITEILAELPKLTTRQREQIRLRLAEIDEEEWLDDGSLTEDEKALIAKRFDDLERNPQSSIPWNEAKERLAELFKRSVTV